MLIAVTATLLMAATPADQQANDPVAEEEQAQTSIDQQQTEEEDESQKVRCRYEHLVNTRIPRRICRTEAEWARIQEDNQRTQDNNARNRGSRGEAGAIYGADGL